MLHIHSEAAGDVLHLYCITVFIIMCCHCQC